MVRPILAVLVVAACNGDSPAPHHFDLGAPDLAGGADLAPSPGPGTRILAGSLFIDLVTPDGWVLIEDSADGTEAVRLSDGTIQPLVPGSSGASAGISLVIGNDVFMWRGVDSVGDGPLSMWSGASGVVNLSKKGVGVAAAANSDGTILAWLDRTMGTGTTGALVVMHTNGTGRIVLADDLGCYDGMLFMGNRLVVARCQAGAKMLTAYDPANGDAKDLFSPGDWFLNNAYTEILARDDAHLAWRVNPDGSAPVQLVSGFASGIYAPDDSAVVFVGDDGSVKRVAPGGAPMELFAGPVTYLDRLSPDGKFLVYVTRFTPHVSSYWLAPADAAGTPVELLAAGYQSRFSDDSAWVLYGNWDGRAGALLARPTAGGSERQLGERVSRTHTAGEARVVFNDGLDDYGNVSVKWIDLASSAPATTLVSGADETFALTPDRQSLVYAMRDGAAGLYVLALPR